VVTNQDPLMGTSENEAEYNARDDVSSTINLIDVILGTIRDAGLLMKPMGSQRSFDEPLNVEKANKFVCELFSEGSLETKHAWYMTRKNDDPRNRGKRRPDCDSLLFELMTITLENINLSVENYITQDLVRILREKMGFHDRLETDYKYLSDFKEGVILKKEI
jgi:hypothetical protein